jgi:hypothetical protein
MPMVYTSSLATPGVSTTSGTGNTETGAISYKPPVTLPARTITLFAASVQGRATLATSLSGLIFRLIRVTTASTGGTATTPNPADTAMAAATATAVTGQTISATGRTNHAIFGCGVSGPGGWQAPQPDAALVQPAVVTTAPSLDMVAASATASLTYEFSTQHSE